MQTASSDLLARERDLNSTSTITLIVTLIVVSMTFGALIVAFMARSLNGRFWSHIQLPGTLWLSTAVLISSSVLFEFARRKLAANRIEAFHRLTLATIALSFLFLLCQIAAGYRILHAGVVLKNNPHSWFIFLFGGLHGLHIIAGLIGFTVLYRRTRERVSGPRYNMGTRVGARGVAIFWHYMDAMWLLLFGLLIFWRR
jgi:cytochrome c oxidase subunit 3